MRKKTTPAGIRPMKLSRLTIGLGVYIVVSAAFMLQINVWLTAKVGNPFLFRSFWAVSVIVLALAAAYAFKARLGAPRIFAVFSVFILAYLLGSVQHYFEEKTHILMYGLLGYLAARDLISVGKALKPSALPKNMAMAAAFVVLISALDEGFQLILPYRFGEWNDFITNILGGILGISLFLVLKKDRG